jgi:hypothetical protein
LEAEKIPDTTLLNKNIHHHLTENTNFKQLTLQKVHDLRKEIDRETAELHETEKKTPQ